jgi:hypothetical protein
VGANATLTTVLPDAQVTAAIVAGTTDLQLLAVTENIDGTVNGTYYYGIKDTNICTSNSFVNALSTTEKRYV